MTTTTLTLRLPKEDLESAERFAEASGLTLAELIARQIRLLASTRANSDEERKGLTSLVGRWDDGEEFADEIDRVVATRGSRPLPRFDL